MMKKEQKYAVLSIDTECGGDAFVYSIDSEKELTEMIGRFDSYNKDDWGVRFYNDSDESYDVNILLNEKGLKKIKEAINKAKPFNSKSLKIEDLLKKDSYEDEDDDF